MLTFLTPNARAYELETWLHTTNQTAMAGQTFTAGRWWVEDMQKTTNMTFVKGTTVRLVIQALKGSPDKVFTRIALWKDGREVAVATWIPALSKFVFLRNLAFRDYGEDVFDWQKFLSLDPETMLAIEGPGAFPDKQTDTFGLLSQGKTVVYKHKNLNRDKDYVIAALSFLEDLPFQKGTIPEFEIKITTATNSFGIFDIGMADPTDHLWNVQYTEGNLSTTNVTQNFNPTKGGRVIVQGPTPTISLLQTPPRLEVIALPGIATLWISTDLNDGWFERPIFVPTNGVGVYPLRYWDSNKVFKVTQP